MGYLTGMGAGIGSLKAALDLAKSLDSAKTQAAINDVKIPLQQHILDAQAALTEANEAQLTAAHRITELEQKIASFEDWEGEKQRYHLQAIDRGAFAYVHKPGMENGEPAMWLCQTCFEKRHKSALQYIAQDRGSGAVGGRGSHSRWGCNLCKAEVVVAYTRKPSEPYAGDGKPESPSRGMATVRLERS